jgi:carbonic anhydrase/acetyltransferase-like protein (isoleucine patch superfamily)
MSMHALDGMAPEFPEDGDAWVAPGARLIGKIVLRKGASVWFNAVLRGDNEPIVVGEGSNVQDGTICHTDMGYPLTIGANCTIGHMAILHGCTVGDGSLIGMGSTVLNGAVIGRNVLVGAGALVTEGKEFPDGTLVVGRPAKVRRELTPEEIGGLAGSAERYRANMRRFRAGLAPAGMPAGAMEPVAN